ARAAVRPVEHDQAVEEREARRAERVGSAVEDAAAQAVAAVAGGPRAADGPVQGEQRIGHSEDAAVLVRDAAALAGPARGAVAADGLVAQEGAVVDAGGRFHVHGRGGYPGDGVRDAAALGDLRGAAGAGGATHRPVVDQSAVTDGE